MQYKLSCFCMKCTSPFVHVTSINEKKIKCPKCGFLHTVDEVPNLAIQIDQEIRTLVKKHNLLRVTFFTRVEFEQDYKLYDSTTDYFKDACDLFTINANPDRVSPPRFDIVAYQFKTQDNARFLLHDASLNPDIYDIAAFSNIKANFDEAIKEPYLYIFSEGSKSDQLKLFDFAHLAYLSKLYSSYYQYLTQRRSLFLLPLILEA